MKLEEDYKLSGGNGSATYSGYSVEAKYNYHEPKSFGSQIFDKTWRRVNFDKSTNGVPSCSSLHEEIVKHGFLSYQAAQALRWWFHAAADAESFSSLCLETRIVKHEIKTSYAITALSCREHVHGEDRSNLMPDWNL